MDRHDCFIGRWVTFHEGHLWIIQEVYAKNHRPILILIMDTEESPCANIRLAFIENELAGLNIPSTIQIIPPISSVNYGRDVGYDIKYIEAPEHIKEISGTKIRSETREQVKIAG